MEVLQPLAGAPATMPGTRTLPDQLEMTDVDVDMDLDLGPIEGVTEMDVVRRDRVYHLTMCFADPVRLP